MFEKKIEKVRFLSPTQDFREDTQDIEYRKDPLTGKWSRINVQRSARVKQGQDGLDYNEFIERSKENCFFCPENLDKKTPRFTPHLIPRGFIERGETRIFPNQFPFAKYHAVGTITHNHFLETHEFSKPQIEDTLQASLEFCRKVYSKDRESGYVTFNWNHLFPSGASIVHPHVQITMDSRPTHMTHSLMDACKKYRKRTGRNYWEDLVLEEEKLKERFIRRINNIAFLASYSPFGNNEVLIVFDDKSSFTDLREEDVSSLSDGVISTLKGYNSIGVKSFNLTTYSWPSRESTKVFNLTMRFISRPPPKPYYTSDVGFMEGLHLERVVENMPEDLAASLRGFF